jgi:NAD/NADP transhydrogenase beta subunit
VYGDNAAPDEASCDASREASSLRRVRTVATLLDDAIRIPGTNIRFGIDPLIGLMPGVGDFLGGAASIYIILEAARAGAPASVLLRMATNVGIDMLVGAVPVLGDLFDFGWKSNTRNAWLLAGHIEQPRETKRASRTLVVAVLLLLTFVAAGISALVIVVLRRLFG